MTEAEWLACSDPGPMLEFLRRREVWARRVISLVVGRAWRPSHRKLRFFACACCRRGCNLPREGPIREAVETSERYADGLAGPEELRAVAEQARDWLGGSHLAAGAWVAKPGVWEAVSCESDVNARRVAAGLHTGQWSDAPPDRVVFSARVVQEQQCGARLG